MTYVYDIETYPNAFTLEAIHKPTGQIYSFELSEYHSDARVITQWFSWLRQNNALMTGFNCVGFDYQIMHMIGEGVTDHRLLYQKAMSIIHSEDRWAGRVKPWLISPKQIDLFLIAHFDNHARTCSLKDLEFNLGLDSIQDLPFEPGTVLSRDQVAELRKYNHHDVKATLRFSEICEPAIKLREELTAKYGVDHTNWNDTKIGKQFLIRELNNAGISTHRGNEPIQTERPHGVRLSDVIFPFITFRNPHFQSILQTFKQTVIVDTKNGFSQSVDHDGFRLDYGTGGLHGSIESSVVTSDDHMQIVDLDVTSYYPNIGIEHNLYPEHLGPKFCEIYKRILIERMKYPKGSPENLVMKLALNGVYGDSNSPYSPFYDPAYTMAITVNGQLMLTMLIEWLTLIPGLQMIQANTDGITVRLRRSDDSTLKAICTAWSSITKMQLERADYETMWIRDVNNYIARSTKGKVKRKGAYRTVQEMIDSGSWHADFSAPIIRDAVAARLERGIPLAYTIGKCHDPKQFCIKVKVNRGHQLFSADGESTIRLQRISRVYVTPFGQTLFKLMEPDARIEDAVEIMDLQGRVEMYRRHIAANRRKGSPLYDQVPTMRVEMKAMDDRIKALQATTRMQRIFVKDDGGQHSVCICNDIKDATMPIDRQYYIAEAAKLTAPFGITE